jgi:hypothetical protein
VNSGKHFAVKVSRVPLTLGDAVLNVDPVGVGIRSRLTPMALAVAE